MYGAFSFGQRAGVYAVCMIYIYSLIHISIYIHLIPIVLTETCYLCCKLEHKLTKQATCQLTPSHC